MTSLLEKCVESVNPNALRFMPKQKAPGQTLKEIAEELKEKELNE